MTNAERPNARTASYAGRPIARVRFGHPSRGRSAAPPFGVAGALTGAFLVALVLGGLAWAAASGSPAAAQHPSLFGGSLVLEDTRPLTVINVATAQVAVRLEGVNAQVGAADDGAVQPVPVSGGTMLVNRISGSFNFLETDDYVTDPNGPGVGLGPLPGTTGAAGYARGSDAYIVRSAPDSTVSLVGQQTVAQAARAQGTPPAVSSAGGTGPSSAPPGGSSPAPPPGPNPPAPATVPPLGYASLGGPVSTGPGAAAVSGPDLWVLVGRGRGCEAVQLHPSDSSRQGLGTARRAGSPAPCDQAALESGGGSVGFAEPGRVEVFPPAGRPLTVATPGSAGAARIVPVVGATSRLWFLADRPDGWRLFGVDALGRTAGPFPLSGLAPSADPVEPALSGGELYTLDQRESPQPTLWTVDTANGRMAPLRGAPSYPVLSPSEKAAFEGAQVVLDGPRVVFNNPQSLEAVVVFTDSSRLPVVVDKSRAVAVSTTGPADLALQPAAVPAGATPAPTANHPSVPVVQPVSQQVTCANTTQKPYAPQITSVTPSSGAALVQWSYQLLDQTDCEPSSWAVQVKALTGGHQPARGTTVVSGQDQDLFTGLRPTTTYQVTVTAFINHQSTTSPPVTFTTSARGPDAPLSVTTRSDGNGHWVVSWTPCTEAANPDCVVPADQWTVTGTACGGSFVGSPPAVQVAGDLDSVTIDAATLQLLGDSLSFSVQGSLASGLTGNPTSDRSCIEAYQKPDASSITLSGQGSEDPSTGTITATLTVQATGDPNSVFGVRTGAAFVYSVTSPDGTRTVGPVPARTATIAGLPPGVALAPSVEIYPAGHTDAAVTVAGAPFKQTLAWPDLSAAQAAGAVDGSDPNRGSVTVTLPPDAPPGPLSAVAPVTVTTPGSGPQIQCGGSGGAVLPYPVQSVTPAHQLTFPMGDLVSSGGSCTVSFSLTDGAQPDPYGGPSPVVTAAFSIGHQPSYSFQAAFVGCADFQCGPLGKPYTVQVDAAAPPFHFEGGGDWTLTAHDPAISDPQLDPCYVSQGIPTPPTFPYEVQLPRACIRTGAVALTVSWTYLGQTESFTATPDNSPGSPATTTTTSTSTTTVATTTTSPTTAATSPTTAPTSASTTGTVAGAASLAGVSLTRAPVAPAARQAVGWSVLGLGLTWTAGAGRRARRDRNRTRKGSR